MTMMMNLSNYDFMNNGSVTPKTQYFTPPINPEQEELQPSINVGVIGHVSHGKRYFSADL